MSNIREPKDEYDRHMALARGCQALKVTVNRREGRSGPGRCGSGGCEIVVLPKANVWMALCWTHRKVLEKFGESGVLRGSHRVTNRFPHDV